MRPKNDNGHLRKNYRENKQINPAHKIVLTIVELNEQTHWTRIT